MAEKLGRRRFITTTAAAVGGLALATALRGNAEAAADERSISAADFAALTPVGFSAIAALVKQSRTESSYVNLPQPVALTMIRAPQRMVRARGRQPQAVTDTSSVTPLGQTNPNSNPPASPPALQANNRPGARVPFSVHFSATPGVPFVDATYRVSHPSWPAPLSMFLTRVSSVRQAPVYQAVFG